MPSVPRTTLMLTLVVSASLSVQPITARETPAPSLRLLASKPRVTLDRHGKRVPLWGLGVWATPTSGAFRLNVTRPSYESPPIVAQVEDEGGEMLRAFPEDAADGWLGLRRFIRVTFHDREGRVVANRAFTICPNSGDRQRLDDSGPDTSTYPDWCGSAYFPFLKGMVWGMDAGWATRVLSGSEFEDDMGSPSLRVPEGRYRVTVRITRRYVRLLEIPDEHARVVLNVRVRNARRDSDDKKIVAEEEPATFFQDVPTVTDPDPNTLPDLAALPLWEMHVDHRKRGDFLSFAASPWNAGPAPLVVEGFRRSGQDVMDAFQYFYDDAGNVVGKAPAGTLEYHRGRGHNHWHFTHLVTFSILDADKKRVVRSRKQSFCIVPTDAVDLTVPGAVAQPWSHRFSSRCGQGESLWVRTALPAGWADTYFQWVAGQSFKITDLPNGRYYVRLHVNPRGLLYDANPDNDIVDRLIRLGGRPGNRRLTVAPWRGIAA